MAVRAPAAFGAAGTNLYVSVVFVIVLGIVGLMVLRDGLREQRGEAAKAADTKELSPMVRWVRGLQIPGTMLYFKSMDDRVLFLILAPMGFATGLLAATIAVGGFIGVPAMMYILSLPAMVASATELVIAFVMGLGGSLFYALDGFVDIRLSMIILAGSLFGIQIGAIDTLSPATRGWLDGIGEGALIFASLFGAPMILQALYKGMREHRLAVAAAVSSPALAPARAPSSEAVRAQLSPVGRFERILVASDGSELSAAAVREAIGMASKCGPEVHVMSLVVPGVEHEGIGESFLNQELETAQTHLDAIKG